MYLNLANRTDTFEPGVAAVLILVTLDLVDFSFWLALLISHL